MRPQVVVALLLLGSLLFLGVRGATRYVQSGATGTTCAVDDQCGSIAEAIAVAASGDTIQIGSGDFSGAGTNTDLAVAKNLAFVGNSSTETFISGGGSTASAFTTSTGVEVSFSAIGFKGFTSSVLALAGGPQATVSSCSFSESARGIQGVFASLVVENSQFMGASTSAIAFSPSGSSSVFSVTGCTFDGNSAPSDGGAISLVPARRSSISMSTFSNNNATENGGAIYISPGDSTLPVILFKNSFENNNAFTASGGAVMADHYVDVRDCEFTHNKAGQSGGALIAFDQVDLVDSLFSGNSVPHMAGKQGGAIYLALTSRPTVKGVTFEENDAGEGGAIFTTSLAITVTESRFDDNTAISGAAVTVFTGSALIVSSTFESNIGDTIGALHTRADLVLTGSTFDLNEVTDIAGAGGAVNCLSAIPGNVPVSLTVTGSTFTDNTAHGRGGAIYSSGCKATISSCTFEGNGANVTLGGALGFQNGALTLMSSVFDMNEAADGGHVWTDDELTTSGNHFHEADADSGILLSTPLSPPNLSGNMYYGSGYSIKALLTPGQELAVTGSSAISGIWVDSGDLKLSLPTADPITIGKLRASTAHIHTSNSLVVTEGLIWGRTNITAATPGLTLTLTETSMSTFERPADYNTTGSRFLDGIVMHNHGTVHIDSVDQTWNDTLLATVPTTQDLNTCLHMANGAHFLAQPNSHTYLGYYCHVLGPVSSFFNASGHVYIDGNVTIHTNYTSSNKTGVAYFIVDQGTNDAIHFMNGPVVIGGDAVVTSTFAIGVAEKFSRTIISLAPGQMLWGSYNNTNITTGDAWGRFVTDVNGVKLEVDDSYRPNPNGGNIAAGLAGALLAIVFLLTVFIYVRPLIFKKKKSEEDDEENDEEKGSKEANAATEKEAVEMARIDAEEKERKKSKKSKPLKEVSDSSADSSASSEEEVLLDDAKDKKSSKKKKAEPEPSESESSVEEEELKSKKKKKKKSSE